MGLLCKAIICGVIAIVAQFALKFYISLDTNKRAYNHAPGRCRYLQGANDGSEDIELLDDGTAILSTGLRYINVSELKDTVGKMLAYKFPESADESAKEPRAVELKIQSKTLDMKTFNPHGLTKYVDKGTTHIYVINHAPEGDAIERFTYEKERNALVHTKTIRHPLIHAANDLVAVGVDKFYVTNDHYFKCECLRMVEMFVLTRLGSIAYYDGTEAKIVGHWLAGPNGINIDKSKKKLYVSSPVAKSIWIYDIEKDMNITYQARVELLTSVDNIIVEPDTGDLWIGAHPVMHETMSLMYKPKSGQAPSQVLRIQLPKKSGQRAVISEIYSNDGSTLSASTVAVPYKNYLLIGTVSQKALVCDLNRDLFLH